MPALMHCACCFSLRLLPEPGHVAGQLAIPMRDRLSGRLKQAAICRRGVFVLKTQTNWSGAAYYSLMQRFTTLAFIHRE
jgi:hypothetical protein